MSVDERPWDGLSRLNNRGHVIVGRSLADWFRCSVKIDSAVATLASRKIRRRRAEGPSRLSSLVIAYQGGILNLRMSSPCKM